MAHSLEETLRRLDALINWERRDRDASMRRGLQPLEALLARLGNPERAFRAVHITGSKGKGTTAALIEAGLRAAGVRTGLYTSPHLERIHERIRIDGAPIEDGELEALLRRVLDARDASVEAGDDARESTWFDCITAVAFLAFQRHEVAWAVVEVGLGGRLDSTNVVYGEVCVLTQVELEHTQVLGPTRAHIAHEKVGIVKAGSVLISGLEPSTAASSGDAEQVVEEHARRLGVPILRPLQPGMRIREQNASLARAALRQLQLRGVPVDPAVLNEALVEQAWLPGRMEARSAGGIPVWIDAAHVPASVQRVLEELRSRPELSSAPVVLLALGKDKDARSILKLLGSVADRLICTTVASGPLVDAGTLAQTARELGIAAETAPDPQAGLARALQLTRADGWVLVVGSFYLAGAVRAHTSPRTEPNQRC